MRINYSKGNKMGFRRGKLRCNYCKKLIRIVPEKDWWVYADNTQVHICDTCKEGYIPESKHILVQENGQIQELGDEMKDHQANMIIDVAAKVLVSLLGVTLCLGAWKWVELAIIAIKAVR